MTDLTAWYLEAIDFSQAPRSMEELRARFTPNIVAVKQLRGASKWEPILRGDDIGLPSGWTTLSELAATRRGIATGANEFFIINDETVQKYGISHHQLAPCIGRANDVPSIIFSPDDLASARSAGAKCWLLDIKSELSQSELAYVRSGEEQGYHTRYITAHRTPWFSMEQRDVAPVWASVFGRGDLEFVFNAAKVKSLTNFHCVYPVIAGDTFSRALVVALNSSAVRSRSKLHARGFGGGLAKFEPNDLKGIPVPDLRLVGDEVLKSLSNHLDKTDRVIRSLTTDEEVNAETDKLVDQAATIAAGFKSQLF